jgi:dTDP-glucose 4,6-dehydratase
VVTGGAGFVGSHLCEALLERGNEVVCVDDLSSGREENLRDAERRDGFEFVLADVSEGLEVTGRVDAVAHLASPASPPEYLLRPLETLAVGSRGTEAALKLASGHGARLLLASTSEVYGDPLVHPQPETYWGNVNPIGPRSVYDEAKRFAEALTMAYRRAREVNTGIVRIFNTYGPRLRASDGRVVSNFVTQALAGEPLTVYGDGSQTRSFCYVDDLVRGLVAMLDSASAGPVNLGNPVEHNMVALAELILELTESKSEVVTRPLPVDDPTRRRPDISLAREVLGWAPTTQLRDGLCRTIEWFRASPGPAVRTG